MKQTKFLLPHWCMIAGWCMFIPLFVGGILWMADCGLMEWASFSWNDIRTLFGAEPLQVGLQFSGYSAASDLFPTLLGVLLVVSGMMVGFSRVRVEDEYTEHIRFEALLMSLWLFAALVVLSLLLFWGLAFLSAAIYVMFIWLLVYIAVLYIKLWLNYRRLRNEE